MWPPRSNWYSGETEITHSSTQKQPYKYPCVEDIWALWFQPQDVNASNLQAHIWCWHIMTWIFKKVPFVGAGDKLNSWNFRLLARKVVAREIAAGVKRTVA